MAEKIIIHLPYDQAFAALVQCKNPVSALLYAFGATQGGIIDLDFAASTLGLDPALVSRGSAALLTYDICRPSNQPPPKELIVDPVQVTDLRELDYGFKGVCHIYEGAVGRIMRKNEIEALYNAYNELNLSADILTLLINTLKSRERLTLRNLEKGAYALHDSGSTDYSSAEAYLSQEFSDNSARSKILALVGIFGRSAINNEKKYIDSWLELAIPFPLIKLAYERTLFNIKDFRWAYANKILLTWHNAGYKTVEQVIAKEAATPRPDPTSSTPKSAEAQLLLEYTKKRQEREAAAAALMAKISLQHPQFTKCQHELASLSSKIAVAGISGGDIDALKSRYTQVRATRDNILGAMSLTIESISPKPDCPKCGDHGYIGAEMCDCFKERLKGTK